MQVTQTELTGVLVVDPVVHRDERGFFLESYSHERYAGAGITEPFVQDNHSRSERGVLRGLHFQTGTPQGKLVYVQRGAILDVVVDIDSSSATYRQHVMQELNDDNHMQIYIPPGYAHGFLVLSDVADVCYKCTQYYDPTGQAGIIWNDPELAIEWPIDSPTLSEKDQLLPTLRELREETK